MNKFFVKEKDKATFLKDTKDWNKLYSNAKGIENFLVLQDAFDPATYNVVEVWKNKKAFLDFKKKHNNLPENAETPIKFMEKYEYSKLNTKRGRLLTFFSYYIVPKNQNEYLGLVKDVKKRTLGLGALDYTVFKNLSDDNWFIEAVHYPNWDTYLKSEKNADFGEADYDLFSKLSDVLDFSKFAVKFFTLEKMVSPEVVQKKTIKKKVGKKKTKNSVKKKSKKKKK